MRFNKFYFKEDDNAISTDVKPSLEKIELKDKLKKILSSKFAEIGKVIKELTRPASKGTRKGLLIFVPDAARKIYAIEDEFVKYVVRDIYDHYRDITRGVLWQMHMNWLFGSDFVMHIVKQLSSDVNEIEDEKKRLKKEYEEKIHPLYTNDVNYKFYDFKLKDSDNVFSYFNPRSKPFWEKFNVFLARVNKEHPRVPKDKLLKYIDNDYSYRKEQDKIVDEFLQTIPEYVEKESKLKKLRDEQYDKEAIINNKLKEALSKINYNEIKKDITELVNQFVKNISHSIVKGSL